MDLLVELEEDGLGSWCVLNLSLFFLKRSPKSQKHPFGKPLSVISVALLSCMLSHLAATWHSSLVVTALDAELQVPEVCSK